MSDHSPERVDELPPWMCSEVESRISFEQKQVVLIVVAAALAGFTASQGVFGVVFGAVWVVVAVLWARSEVEDACTDAAWAQYEHEWENQR